MLPLYWYSMEDYPYGESYSNKPKSVTEFMTEMMSISSTGTITIFDLVKKIINEMPGKYCLICSHFENLKLDFLMSSNIGIINHLNLAFISLDELPEKFNNPIILYLK